MLPNQFSSVAGGHQLFEAEIAPGVTNHHPRIDDRIEVRWGDTGRERCFTQSAAFVVGPVRDRRGLVVANVGTKRRHEHQRPPDVFLDLISVELCARDAVAAQLVGGVAKNLGRVEDVVDDDRGTEITIIESLARAFGTEFLRRFTDGHESVGEAVRGARLQLLGRGSPLGLVYIPFVIAGLRMDPPVPAPA